MILELLHRHLRQDEVAKLAAAAIKPQSARTLHLARLVCKALTLEAFKSTSTVASAWSPQGIVQFWDQPMLPPDVAHCVSSWSTIREVPHRLFDNNSARQYILESYNAEHLQAFDYCHHPAMQSDYFRLAYIAQEGGVYIDADERWTGRRVPFDEISCKGVSLRPIFRTTSAGPFIAHKPGAVAEALEAGQAEVYLANDPLIARPNHSLVRWALSRATRLILDARSRGEICRIHWTTGPDNITLAVLDHALSSLRRDASCDIGVLTSWTNIAAWQGELAYRQTALNWRHIQLEDGASRIGGRQALSPSTGSLKCPPKSS